MLFRLAEQIGLTRRRGDAEENASAQSHVSCASRGIRSFGWKGGEMMDRWMRTVPLGLLLCAACRGDADDAPRPPAAEPVTPAAPADSGSAPDSAASADSAQAGLAVVVERRGEGVYVLFGRTEAQALELSVEDGHNVLYGPTELQVSGGAFRTGLTLAPTNRPTVFAYIAEPSGARQWVVPIPLDGSRVVWGSGAADLTEPAAAP
jgi:hypothetical protein